MEPKLEEPIRRSHEQLLLSELLITTKMKKAISKLDKFVTDVLTFVF